ncbi:MAG: prolyl oligopeptidase family serine peptidase [Hyphomicrobiaceae bacterium]
MTKGRIVALKNPKSTKTAKPAKPAARPGTWPSPISPRDLTRGARRFGHIQGDGPFVYWTEGRPEEKGRQVIVRAKPGARPEDILPAPLSARSRVHEYGGAEFLVAAGTLYFVNSDDQDIWLVDLANTKSKPRRLTQAPDMRFADIVLDEGRQRLIAVAERHAATDPHALPDNLLVAIQLAGPSAGTVTPLVTGRDFYAFARLTPDGRRLAFLGWDLPDMPWDQSALYVCAIGPDGTAGRPQRIAGGKGVAAMQPDWLDNERLLFLTDETGFGNVHVWNGQEIRQLTRLKAELGQPMWTLGALTFVVEGPDRVTATADIDAKPSLVTITELDRHRPKVDVKPLAVAAIGNMTHYDGGLAAGIGRAKASAALAAMPHRRKAPVILKQATDLALSPRGLSAGHTVSFRGGDRKTSFAQYYPPASATNRLPKGVLPPALVLAHGGPTASAGRGLALRVQYYTSRGFAVLDVDYAGSTGYGRTYRERLDGQWGIADVADCAAAARFLAAEGLADPAQIAIAGGSAGGYTVLMALATTKVFAAGSSHYGISDLSLLMEDTHKFESGYLHRLLGTTPKNWRKTCEARSPKNLVDSMSAPLILFQGLDDKVVPPAQSRLIHESLKAKGVATELYEFEGESHGFRQASTIETVAKAELAFLLKAFAIR